MAAAFEYRVCKVRVGRVHEVNGQWQGTIAAPDLEQTREALKSHFGLSGSRGSGPGFWRSLFSRKDELNLAAIMGPVAAAYQSCPETWKYLQEAGSEGWELVAATTVPESVTVSEEDDDDSCTTQFLYLKRPK